MSHPRPPAEETHSGRPGVWSEADLIADVEAGPQGPQVGAFFDFDGTLIDAGRDELAERRRAFAARLRGVVARLITIDEIDAARRQEAVGVAP